LRRVGMLIAREVERLRKVVHPNDPGLEGFTAPSSPRRHSCRTRTCAT
jgi:hypothetical protein